MNSISTAAPAVNRRKYPRKAFYKPISILVSGHVDLAEGIEISEGGISLKSNMVLEKSKKIIVNFFVPYGDFYSIRATVRNIYGSNSGASLIKVKESPVYGLSFDEIPVTLKRQIRAFIARI